MGDVDSVREAIQRTVAAHGTPHIRLTAATIQRLASAAADLNHDVAAGAAELMITLIDARVARVDDYRGPNWVVQAGQVDIDSAVARLRPMRPDLTRVGRDTATLVRVAAFVASRHPTTDQIIDVVGRMGTERPGLSDLTHGDLPNVKVTDPATALDLAVTSGLLTIGPNDEVTTSYPVPSVLAATWPIGPPVEWHLAAMWAIVDSLAFGRLSQRDRSPRSWKHGAGGPELNATSNLELLTRLAGTNPATAALASLPVAVGAAAPLAERLLCIGDHHGAVDASRCLFAAAGGVPLDAGDRRLPSSHSIAARVELFASVATRAAPGRVDSLHIRRSLLVTLIEACTLLADAAQGAEYQWDLSDQAARLGLDLCETVLGLIEGSHRPKHVVDQFRVEMDCRAAGLHNRLGVGHRHAAKSSEPRDAGDRWRLAEVEHDAAARRLDNAERCLARKDRVASDLHVRAFRVTRSATIANRASVICDQVSRGVVPRSELVTAAAQFVDAADRSIRNTPVASFLRRGDTSVAPNIQRLSENLDVAVPPSPAARTSRPRTAFFEAATYFVILTNDATWAWKTLANAADSADEAQRAATSALTTAGRAVCVASHSLTHIEEAGVPGTGGLRRTLLSAVYRVLINAGDLPDDRLDLATCELVVTVRAMGDRVRDRLDPPEVQIATADAFDRRRAAPCQIWATGLVDRPPERWMRGSRTRPRPTRPAVEPAVNKHVRPSLAVTVFGLALVDPLAAAPLGPQERRAVQAATAGLSAAAAGPLLLSYVAETADETLPSASETVLGNTLKRADDAYRRAHGYGILD